MRSEHRTTPVLTKAKSSGFRLLAVALVIALGVGVRASVVLSRPQPGETPDSLGSSIFQYVAAFFPYLLALFLLAIPNLWRKSLAPGIALVSSTLYLVGCLIVLVLGGIFYWGGYPLLWLFILSHLLVAVASKLALKDQAGVVFGAAVIIVYVGIGVIVSRVEDTKRLKAEKAAAAVAASKTSEGVEAIKDLAWCAIQYKTTAGGGYPPDLQVLESFSKCSRGKFPVELPDYFLAYSPIVDSTGKFSRFEASVVPRDSGAASLNSYFGDESGVVLKQPPGSYKDILALGDDPFPVLRYLIWHLKIFASGRPGVGYPPDLRDLPQSWLTNMLHRATAPADNMFFSERGDYRFIYRPAASSLPVRGFEVQARCQQYAEDCVRSYLVTDTGEVHATSEDRAPALDDSLASSVEMRGGLECAAPCESVQP